MIKTYVPNALMLAATDIVKVHSKEHGIQGMKENDLIKLLERIERCKPERLRTLALSLIPKEVYALCKYLPHNKYKKPLINIINAINYNMNDRYYDELFIQWQRYPRSRVVLKILSENDNEKVRGDKPKIPIGKITAWHKSTNCFGDIVYYIQSISNPYDSFEKRYEDAGFMPNCPMFTECITEFLTSCSMHGYMQVGDSKVAHCVQTTKTETTELILLNLLLSGKTERKFLTEFNKCYAEMLKLWREPYSGRFPENQIDAQKIYYWLYNYIEMVNSFATDADHRRRNFWEQYLDRCEVVKIKKHRMLIFNFDKYCAVEFEVVGRIFVYEKEYFENEIRQRAQLEYVTQDLKNWMLAVSKYEYEKTHQGHWEPEVSYRMRKFV